MPFHHLRLIVPFIVAVAIGSLDASHATSGTPHPQAPLETAQLEFLIGDWRLETTFENADGSTRHSRATLRAWYILDGFGIQVEERHPQGSDSDEPEFVSTQIFVFDRDAKRWTGSSINSLGNRKKLDGSFTDGKLILIQSGKLFQNRPGVNRLTYHSITEKSFSLTFDHSPDDGETWRKGSYSFVARRVTKSSDRR